MSSLIENMVYITGTTCWMITYHVLIVTREPSRDFVTYWQAQSYYHMSGDMFILMFIIALLIVLPDTCQRTVTYLCVFNTLLLYLQLTISAQLYFYVCWHLTISVITDQWVQVTFAHIKTLDTVWHCKGCTLCVLYHVLLHVVARVSPLHVLTTCSSSQ